LLMLSLSSVRCRKEKTERFFVMSDDKWLKLR